MQMKRSTESKISIPPNKQWHHVISIDICTLTLPNRTSPCASPSHFCFPYLLVLLHRDLNTFTDGSIHPKSLPYRSFTYISSIFASQQRRLVRIPSFNHKRRADMREQRPLSQERMGAIIQPVSPTVIPYSRVVAHSKQADPSDGRTIES